FVALSPYRVVALSRARLFGPVIRQDDDVLAQSRIARLELDAIFARHDAAESGIRRAGDWEHTRSTAASSSTTSSSAATTTSASPASGAGASRLRGFTSLLQIPAHHVQAHRARTLCFGNETRAIVHTHRDAVDRTAEIVVNRHP